MGLLVPLESGVLLVLEERTELRDVKEKLDLRVLQEAQERKETLERMDQQ